jgi:hypothetical protein
MKTSSVCVYWEKIRLQNVVENRRVTVVQGRYTKRTVERMIQWMKENRKFHIMQGIRIQGRFEGHTWISIGASSPFATAKNMLDFRGRKEAA